MKVTVFISRIFVGIIFILSGFIKMNDPLGFSYKLEEYFSPTVLNLEFLTPLALPLAVFIVIFEVILGVAVIIGYKPKWTIYSMTAMIVFFSFLTFYSAYFDKVKDCGCFGDVVKLTPWQSFTKDIVLLIFCLLFLLKLRLINPLFHPKVNFWIVLSGLLCCILFSIHVLRYIPVFDFRPYKVGNNINELMQIPEDAPKPIYEYRWKFKLDSGKEKTIVTEGEYPSMDGELMTVETEMIQEGYKSPIKDFTMLKEGLDHAQLLLQEEKLIIIVSSDLSKLKGGQLKMISELIPKFESNGFKVIGLLPSNNEIHWIDAYACDTKTLKTIIRSNPGILTLERGTIVRKQSWREVLLEHDK